MHKPKVIFFDIETAPIIATTWSLYPKSLSHENILKDWYIICGAWKLAGNKKVQSTQISSTLTDKQVCKDLRNALSNADILVTHNGDKFDIKKLNARLIYHNLPPLPLIPTVDTLKEVRKIAAFTSNRLDYLSKQLIGKGKIKTEYNLWLDVIKDDKKALKKMVDYCKVDVIRLEQLYDRLRPYMKTHPHIGVLSGEDRLCSCNKCGGTNLKKNGIRATASGIKKQEVQCLDCFSYSRISLNLLLK